jgi:hypothetical protein
MTEVTRIHSMDELQTGFAGRERTESRKMAVEALRTENPLAQNRADSGWALADMPRPLRLLRLELTEFVNDAADRSAIDRIERGSSIGLIDVGIDITGFFEEFWGVQFRESVRFPGFIRTVSGRDCSHTASHVFRIASTSRTHLQTPGAEDMLLTDDSIASSAR